MMDANNLVDVNQVQRSCNGAVIRFTLDGRITSPESLKFHLSEIFTNDKYANSLYGKLIDLELDFSSLTVVELLISLRKLFKNNIHWDGLIAADVLTNLIDLLVYERQREESLLAYDKLNKPNPDAILWPDSVHPKYPQNKYALKPYVKKFHLLDKHTAIGSAGSCFAAEIAKFLQNNGYNYIVRELADNPKTGALVDAYELGSGTALFSANFGYLFNTPSLKQLAQKAFNKKVFTKYLVEKEPGIFCDPYRENVFFTCEENFINDYPKHIEAVNQVLLDSEVFIFTAGLNECWQMNDGTYISRNIKSGFQHQLRKSFLTVQDNIDNLCYFFETVKQYNPQFKLILTLSPIPLIATHRADTHHILEANTHSKAVLRVAIDEVVNRYDDVYYLPSYEYVMECIKDPWDKDHRHVTPETVAKVMGMFQEMFIR